MSNSDEYNERLANFMELRECCYHLNLIVLTDLTIVKQTSSFSYLLLIKAMIVGSSFGAGSAQKSNLRW